MGKSVSKKDTYRIITNNHSSKKEYRRIYMIGYRAGRLSVLPTGKNGVQTITISTLLAPPIGIKFV